MVKDEPQAACHLTECDACRGLASLQELRPYYGERSDADRPAIVGLEEEIFCPNCGYRTQAIGDIND
jgi:hypothetical protein